ncbi:DNA-binding transcriptional LysR family regulator [Rhodoligotrophos appendicifer]|uniref:LysR family transcriptional regulator n=1 Tax=Rhodoligotrophos appendicifer TaxID=987056 RepID=UPI001184ED1B|nr:LysR family transcriptional regulator [Rhodoligotrophos appendicifer]
MIRLDLVTLRLFLRVCEEKSVTRGASHINLVPSAASRRLNLLEESIGTRLLLRKAHGVEPTAAGLTFLRYARDVLHLSDRLEANLSQFRFGERGLVRIFASSSALVQRLAADLAAFSQEHPQIGIELEERPTSETLEALDQKETDIGIIIRNSEPIGLRSFPYTEDRLNVILRVDHPLAGRKSLKFLEILEEEFVALDRATAVYRLITEQSRKLGKSLKMRMQVRSFEAMCQMVKHGLGIGILPEHAGVPLAAALGLRLLSLDEPWACRKLLICVRPDDQLEPQADRLIQFLLRRSSTVEVNSPN